MNSQSMAHLSLYGALGVKNGTFKTARPRFQNSRLKKEKRFQDFEIAPKFSEAHEFRGTILYPLH